MNSISRIVLLIGLFAFLILPLCAVIGEEKKEEENLKFVGATKCKMCHNLKKYGKFYDDWESKEHAKAFDTLSDEEKKDPKCQKCHTTGFGKPGGFMELDDKDSMKMVGVQCEMCHGPGEKHIKSKRNGDVIPHAWEPDEKACEKCHNPESPTWKEDRYVDEDGNKSGFIYKLAVKKMNHSKVFEELGKKPPKTGDL
ncbi:MAG: hypothetical protein JXR73_15895 [Candidatus Omnitrophica bacterium]|nr:hypothetical protein [Candidatus Omnitrophota bacterium]